MTDEPYNVTPSLIGWAHTQNDPGVVIVCNHTVYSINGKTILKMADWSASKILNLHVYYVSN